jgi:flap endonuclease-1
LFKFIVSIKPIKEKTISFMVGMGVDIGSIFQKETITFDDLRDRIIVIDAYNFLHQFLASIRQRDGTPLKDARGEVTSHLSGIFQRTANLIEAHIKPVYSFDGVPHKLKVQTIEERKQRKIQAEKEYQIALDKGDLKTARIKAQQTGRLTNEMIRQTKDLLTALGIPFVQAPSEGEAQACHMVRKGDAYAVGSQDYDCLLVGSPVLIRNLTSTGKRKLPGKEFYKKIDIKQIRLMENLHRLQIHHKQLVDMALLIGTDFNQGVRGIGPKKSLSLIKKYESLENVLEYLNIDEEFNPKDIDTIRNIFLNPKITDDYVLKWFPADEKEVMDILCDQHQFNKTRVKDFLKKYDQDVKITKQKTLF